MPRRLHLSATLAVNSILISLSLGQPALADDFASLRGLPSSDPLVLSKWQDRLNTPSELRGQTLQQSELLALQTDPSIRESNWQQKLVAARLSESRLKRLPTLKVLDLFAYSNSPFYVFGSLLQQNRVKQSDFSNLHTLNHPKPMANFIGSAYFLLPIFNQLQTSAQIAQERLASKQALQQRDRAAQEIRLKLVKAFYGVLLAESRKEVAAEAVRSAQSELKRITDLRDVGKVVESDVLAMELQLAQFKQDELAADGALSVACAEFNTVIGSPITLPVKLSGRLVDKSFEVEPETSLVEKSVDLRPDLQVVRIEIAREHEEIRKAKGKYLPNVKGFGGAIFSGQGVVNATPNFAVGGIMSWDLDPTRPALVRQARASEQIARARCDERANFVKLEVVRAFQGYKVAADSKAVAAAAVNKARENLRIVKNRYQVGLTTVTELLRAQTFLVQAQNSYLSAIFDNYVGYANLLLAVGQLTEVKTFEG